MKLLNSVPIYYLLLMYLGSSKNQKLLFNAIESSTKQSFCKAAPHQLKSVSSELSTATIARSNHDRYRMCSMHCHVTICRWHTYPFVYRWISEFLANWSFFFGQLGSCSFFENFLMEFIVCMYLKVCVWLDTQETPLRGRSRQFYPQDGHAPESLYTSFFFFFFFKFGGRLNTIKYQSSHPIKKKRGMENLMLDIFCVMTLVKK